MGNALPMKFVESVDVIPGKVIDFNLYIVDFDHINLVVTLNTVFKKWNYLFILGSVFDLQLIII